MALQSSGAISMNDINVELGNSGTAQISLNDAAVRSLLSVASGAISLNDAYGASADAQGSGPYNYVMAIPDFTQTGEYIWEARVRGSTTWEHYQGIDGFTSVNANGSSPIHALGVQKNLVPAGWQTRATNDLLYGRAIEYPAPFFFRDIYAGVYRKFFNLSANQYNYKENIFLTSGQINGGSKAGFPSDQRLGTEKFRVGRNGASPSQNIDEPWYSNQPNTFHVKNSNISGSNPNPAQVFGFYGSKFKAFGVEENVDPYAPAWAMSSAGLSGSAFANYADIWQLGRTDPNSGKGE